MSAVPPPCVLPGVLLALLLGPALGAQIQHKPALAFRQALVDAGSDARSLIVATHPDDPYRALALYLRRVHGHEVRVLVATRGAGGQNAVGPALGEELAQLRERETRHAARALDVELGFLGLRDFGYCREAAEALDRWRRELPEQKLQAELKAFDPDYVWTPHGPAEGHGQKAAVVSLLLGALSAHRQQLGSETRPAFFRAPGDGEQAQLSIDLRELDPLEGRSFRELDHEVLLLHRTQGPHGPVLEETQPELVFVGSYQHPKDFVSPLNSREPFLSGAASFSQATRAWLDLPRRPKAWVEDLAKRLGLWRAALGKWKRNADFIDAQRRLARRTAALQRALLLAARIKVEAQQRVFLSLGQLKAKARVRLFHHGSHRVRIRSLQGIMEASGILFRGSAAKSSIAPGERMDIELELRLPKLGGFGGKLHGKLPVEILGEKLGLPFELDLETELPIQLEARPKSRFLVPAHENSVRLALAIDKQRIGAWTGELAMISSSQLRFRPESNEGSLPIRVELPEQPVQRLLALQVEVPDWARRAGQGRLPWISARFGLQAKGAQSFAASCELSFRPVRVQKPDAVRIGIVRGPDDTVEEALRSFGMPVVALDERTLTRVSLEGYQTVLIDSRALHRRLDAVAWIPRFLDYARRGGHLVVLYHKNSEFNQERIGARLAPFPLRLGKERITREDAPVRVLLPKHPLLNSPNKILARDWDAWVQERGLYLPEMGAYDPRFDELLEIREQPFSKESGLSFVPQKGALLFARFGRGSYVYCSLVLHRQLRAFHPGVARLLLNLVTPRPASPR